MAQWGGEFLGLSHASKLADAETTLRAAVAAFRAAELGMSVVKAKAVRRLAARVLTLRLKLLKAQRNAFGPVNNSGYWATKLEGPERATSDAGVGGILAEFDATDAHE